MEEKISLSEAVELVFPKFGDTYESIMKQWRSNYTVDKREALGKMATFTNNILKLVRYEQQLTIALLEGIAGSKEGQIATMNALKELKPQRTLQGKTVQNEDLARGRERLMYQLGFTDAVINNWDDELESHDLKGEGLENRRKVAVLLSDRYTEMLKEWHRVYE